MDATVSFARNVSVTVGNTSLETYLEGGVVACATESQVASVGEALSTLREAAAPRLPCTSVMSTRSSRLETSLCTDIGGWTAHSSSRKPPRRYPI